MDDGGADRDRDLPRPSAWTAQGPHPAGAHRRGGATDRRRAWRAASIQEITDTADIGFGSFYNHFESKDQLFQPPPRRSWNAGAP